MDKEIINTLYLISIVFNTAFLSWLLINYQEYYNHINFYYSYFFDNIYNEYDEEEDEECEETRLDEKPPKRYEDKYLEEIRKLDKEYKITEEEKEIIKIKFVEFYKDIDDVYKNKIEELFEESCSIEMKLTKYEENLDNDTDYYPDSNDEYLGKTKDERIKKLLKMNSLIYNERKKLSEYIETKEYTEDTIKKSQEKAENFVINQRLEKLKNCFVIEYTPLGNVLMCYDNEREAFKFYSDNYIPYRYLEVATRKYVKQFNCRPLYVDMEEELKLAEERLDKEQKDREQRDREQKDLEESKKVIDQQECDKTEGSIEPKKSVFAKFKKYNKEAGTGHVITAAPPKNSIPNKLLNEKSENDKILLKDKANRYSYQGKMANFSFITKVDKKVVNKKSAMTFADFKKIIEIKTD
jgi:hypothetical protein